MAERVRYGSLEEQERNRISSDASTAYMSGIAFAQLESRAAGPSSTGYQHPTETQLFLLDELERKQKAKAIPVPTNDALVKKALRVLEEPIAFFAETMGERRERLRRLVSERIEAGKLSKLQRDSLAQLASGGPETTQSKGQPVIDDREEFFVPGSLELVETRKFLVDFSLNRSKARLVAERAYYSRKTDEVKAERLSKCQRLGLAECYGSHVGSERPLSAISFAADSEACISGDWGGNLSLWSIPDCRQLLNYKGHAERIGNVHVNPEISSEMSFASCAADGSIKLWNINRAKAVGELKGHTARVARVAIHPCGRLLGSASFDYSWRLWDLGTQRELMLQEGHSKEAYAIAFHQDGALAATGGYDAIGRIWDIRIGRAIWTLQGHLASILSIEFAPDGRHIATGGSDDAVRLWDLRALRPTVVVPAHPSLVSQLRYMPDGDALVTASFDHTLRVWGTHDWKPLATLAGHDNKVTAVDVSRDGRWIVSACYDRTFKLWSMPNGP